MATQQMPLQTRASVTDGREALSKEMLLQQADRWRNGDACPANDRRACNALASICVVLATCSDGYECNVGVAAMLRYLDQTD